MKVLKKNGTVSAFNGVASFQIVGFSGCFGSIQKSKAQTCLGVRDKELYQNVFLKELNFLRKDLRGRDTK